MRKPAENTKVPSSTGGQPRPPAGGRAIPDRLGRYCIVQEIGKGAMGVVYRARDPRINREVALKAIPLTAEFEGKELEEARTKFFREAEMAGRLSHPHIVTIHERLWDHAGRALHKGLEDECGVGIAASLLFFEGSRDDVEAFPIAVTAFASVGAIGFRAVERAPVAVRRHDFIGVEQ